MGGLLKYAVEEGAKYGLDALKNIIKNKPKGAGDKWAKYLGDKYDDFFDSFGAVYKDLIKKKDLKSFQDLKQTSGKSQFEKIVKKTKKLKKLTSEDTKKAQGAFSIDHSASAQKNIARSWFMNNKGPEMVEATKIVADAMIKNASTVKKFDPRTKKMVEVFDFSEGRPFRYEQMLPKLKAQFPEIFANMNLNKKDKRNWVRYVRSKVMLPKHFKSKKHFQTEYLTNRFRSMYAPEGNTTIDNQFIFDVWRSRPAEFRTHNTIQDVDTFFHFLDDVGYFNPRSENFYRTMDPDFSAYKKFREYQKTLPKGTQLSHKLHTVVPDPFFETRLLDDLVPVQKIQGNFASPNIHMSDPVPFSGAEGVNLHLLSKKKNIHLQPLLEGKIYKELQKPIAKRNIKYLQDLEQQMIDAKITTRISDPIQGDDRVYGYVAETIDPKTGFKDGGLVSIEEVIGYNHG